MIGNGADLCSLIGDVIVKKEKGRVLSI